MTFEEIVQASREFHVRADAIGLYRFLRDRIDHAESSREEGIARTMLADVLVKWQLGSPTTIAAELSRARSLLKSYPEETAWNLFVHLYWCGTENNAANFERVKASYDALCRKYPGAPGVQRWRGRITVWMGRLALAQGDLSGAISHNERSLEEYARFEPDPEAREQLSRMSKLRLAQFALWQDQLVKARRYLDECEGSTISRLWETMRACTEVEYAIHSVNPERARFWFRIAQSWATPQSEAMAVLTLTQARLAYALGDTNKARLLTLEARRLAAQFKQDQMLPEIREFYRVQTAGLGAGKLAQGGIPSEQAPLRVAVAGPEFRPGRGRRR